MAHPILSYYLGIPANATIAASMAGTAAATVVSSSVSCVNARYMEVFNMTGRNLEIVLGKVDGGTADYTSNATATIGSQGQFFVPGTASSSTVRDRFECPVSQGMKIFVRTTENTPITCSSVAAFIINLWA